MYSKIKVSIVFGLLVLIGIGFQNCSKVDFDKDSNEVGSSSVAPDSSPGDVLKNLMVQGSSSIEAISACMNSSCNDSLINPKKITLNTRLIEVSGTCTTGDVKVDLEGDVLNSVSNSTSCVNGQFKQCTLLKEHYDENQVLVNQGADKTRFDVLLNAPPVVTLSMDSFELAGSIGTVTGKCMPYSALNFTIYNQKQNSDPVVCSEEGTYKFEKVKIIASVKIKKLFVEQISSSAPTQTIYFDVAQPGLVPNCGFKSFSSNTNICQGKAGKVQGTCLAGLPVDIEVNGLKQNIAFCSSQGTFSVDDILFSTDSSIENELKISQTTPFGQKCEATNSTLFN